MLGGSSQRQQGGYAQSGITPQKYAMDTRSVNSLASQHSPQGSSIGAGSQVSMLSMHSPSLKYGGSDVMMASPGKASERK